MTIEPIALPPSIATPTSSFQFRPTVEVPIDEYETPPRDPADEGIVEMTTEGGFLKGVPIPIIALSGYTSAAIVAIYGLTATDLKVMDAYVAGYGRGREDWMATQEQRRKKRELSKARRLKKLLAIALENEA